MAIQWDNFYETRFISKRNTIDEILNEGHRNGYEVLSIYHTEQTKWTQESVATGTHIVFRKIPETVEVKTFNFESGLKRIEKSLKGVESALSRIAQAEFDKGRR